MREPNGTECRLLSIDACYDGEGWTWDNGRHVANVPRSYADMPARQLLKALRADGYLRADSAGKCAIDDDDDEYRVSSHGRNVVICDRRNGRPVYAIEYGAAQ